MSVAPRSEQSMAFTITELVRASDVTPRAIRFHEDMGLLEPARAGRNRVCCQHLLAGRGAAASPTAASRRRRAVAVAGDRR